MNASMFFDFDILIVYLPITCERKPQKMQAIQFEQ